MIECLNEQLEKFCENENIIEGIYNNFSKVVGIISNLSDLSENKKSYGKTILLINTNNKKLLLNQLVEFDKKRIKWEASNYINGFGFYLVDPYWVRSYKVDLKVEVPVKIFVDDKITSEMRVLNFDQFMQSRLNQFYVREKVPYICVAAYNNFYKMKRPGQYYKALNSTVRNYFINEKQLKKIISVINHERNKIKKEWMEHLRKFYNEKEISKEMKELYEKNRSADIIPFEKKKTS
jgi:nitrate reductase NapAB chaperone NapD